MVKNKFNLLGSKTWLPFQKSWFRWAGEEQFLLENFGFFTKSDEPNPTVFYAGNFNELATKKAQGLNLQLITDINEQHELQFALIDLRQAVTLANSFNEINKIISETVVLACDLFEKMKHRRFISIAIPQWENDTHAFPAAWELALRISNIYSLKDEKILCYHQNEIPSQAKVGNDTAYVLYFRKDEQSVGTNGSDQNLTYFKPIPKSQLELDRAWFILKPPPRKKDEILHPAKFPEVLPLKYIEQFSDENDLVFDPMSGTGSTLVAALQLNRRALGTELSPFFASIAKNKIQNNLFNQQAELLELDANLIDADRLKQVNYVITSPPYWDMLNMKGAEYQARRKEKGLQLNYSENPSDLGNINDYEQFVDRLAELYIKIGKGMVPGSVMTIVVKNVKKKGKNYPLAWDLSLKLSAHFTLLSEQFWCQDDINIAPYGYGNTWVSNTFHQYILNFQTPKANL